MNSGIKDGIRVAEKTHCFLCGSQGRVLYPNLRDRSYTAPGSWTLLRCPKDGLVWINPQPVPEEIGKIYAEYSTHAVTNPGSLPFGWLRKVVRQGILETAFGYENSQLNGVERAFGWLCSRFAPLRDSVGGMVMWLDAAWRGNLLDVGCGNGEIAAYVRNMGWEVTGVEPDPIAAGLAREKFGLKVYEGTVEEAQLQKESFDVITMHHVIEHLPDSHRTLEECHRVLKPGGRLVIITPNIESLASRIFGSAWLWLDPPRHFNLFSRRTLSIGVEQTGFQVAGLDLALRNAPSVWYGSRLIRLNKTLPGGLPKKQGLGFQIEGFAFLIIEYILNFINKNAGEELMLIATKRCNSCPVEVKPSP